MFTKSWTSALTLLLILSAPAYAQNAQSILETAREKQIERWQGVDTYLVEQTVVGTRTKTYFQRVEVEDDNGATQVLFLPAAAGGACIDLDAMSADEIRTASLTNGLLGASGGGPDAKESVDQMAKFIATAELVGTDSIDGQNAYHLKSDKLTLVQEVEGRQYSMDSMSLWLDTDEYVPLKMQVNGTLTSGSEVKPMTIENRPTDYRQVPGSDMYEAFRVQTKMTGMMDAAQEAEVRRAQAEMAQIEKEMDSMPADQRQMMEKMMGPQIEMMRQMATSGGIETEIVVNAITVNAELPTGVSVDCITGYMRITPANAPILLASNNPPPPAPVRDDLTAMVQRDLETLGYEPGNTDGELTTATIVAISKFQAENSMDVTGDVTPQLAGILSAKVSAANAPPPAPAAPARDPEALRAAQQACLQAKIDAAQASQKKKRGFGRLMSAVSRTAGQMGNYDIQRTAGDVYSANATAEDLAAAAEDLGLTEDDVQSCQNPP